LFFLHLIPLDLKTAPITEAPTLFSPSHCISGTSIMSSIFCCSGVKPYRPQRLDYDRESKFVAFTDWSSFPKSSSVESNVDEQVDMSNTYAIQVVQQVNFGPLESKRYFVATKHEDSAFVEVTEQHLIDANYQKVNS
jgi:hypothetical protein